MILSHAVLDIQVENRFSSHGGATKEGVAGPRNKENLGSDPVQSEPIAAVAYLYCFCVHRTRQAAFRPPGPAFLWGDRLQPRALPGVGRSAVLLRFRGHDFCAHVNLIPFQYIPRAWTLNGGQHLANIPIEEIFQNPAYMGIFRKFMTRTADEVRG